MFDINAGELLVIGAVALVVIGPKELPGVLRAMGQGAAKLRRMAGEFRGQFDEAMREADVEQARRDAAGLGDTVRSAASFSPLQTIRNELSGVRDELRGAAASATAAVAATSAPARAAPLAPPALPGDDAAGAALPTAAQDAVLDFGLPAPEAPLPFVATASAFTADEPPLPLDLGPPVVAPPSPHAPAEVPRAMAAEFPRAAGRPA